MQQAADDEMAVLQQRMTEVLGLPGLTAGARNGADESAKLQLLQAALDELVRGLELVVRRRVEEPERRPLLERDLAVVIHEAGPLAAGAAVFVFDRSVTASLREKAEKELANPYLKGGLIESDEEGTD